MAEDFGDRASAETPVADPNWGPKTLAFLAATRQYPNVTAAAEAAGVSREAHYRRLKRNPAYLAAFEEAWRAGIEAMVDEATRRAMKGVSRPVLYHGVPVMMPVDPNDPEGGMRVLMEVEYSDQILLKMLAAYKPEKFTERVRQEVTGEGGGPVKTSLTLHFVKEPFERADDTRG